MADSLTTKKVTDLPESTEPADEDLFLAGSGGTASLIRYKWSNIWNKILASIRNKIIANDLITTAAGYVLDARQGQVLDAKIAELNTNSLKYKQVTGTTDAAGNLVLPGSIRQVLSIYPVTVDVAIIKFFTNSFGTRYVTLQKWSDGELLTNSNATVNVVYSDV